MKVLMVGDVVGKPGRRFFAKIAKHLKETREVNAVIVNGENSAGGNGITISLAEELFKGGADVITLGDHAWGQKDLQNTIGPEKRIVRPANYPEGAPGQGWTLVQTPLGPIVVVNILGRVFMNPMDCPFRTMDRLLTQIPKGVPIFVDFHAEATSEKIAMGYYLDGRVTAVVGTHTHVQTSDAKILSKGTAYLTDLGMTGPAVSVIGQEVPIILRRFLSGMPVKFNVPDIPAVLEGAIIEFDRTTCKALSIQAVRYREEA